MIVYLTLNLRKPYETLGRYKNILLLNCYPKPNYVGPIPTLHSVKVLALRLTNYADFINITVR